MLRTGYKKRGQLIWAIASKKSFISLHSAAFVTVFGPCLHISHYSKLVIFEAYLKAFPVFNVIETCRV